MKQTSHNGGETPSLSGGPSSAEHENRFASNAPSAESKKEQGGAGKKERKKGRAQSS